MDFTNETLKRGERWQGYIPVAETDLALPVTAVCGKEEGKTVLITAGIHCREYVGIETAIRLSVQLRADQLYGQVIIVLLCNPSGFREKSLDIVPEDGKNLNRVFPAADRDTVSACLAHTLEKVFLSVADYHIDLHCGGADEELVPHVYCQKAAVREARDMSRAMGGCVDVPYRAYSVKDTGGIYNRAGALGIPGILIERGGNSLWTEEEITAYLRDVNNVLRFLQVLRDGLPVRRYHPADISEIFYETADIGECWYPAYQAGDLVEEGKCLGEIRTIFGKTVGQIFARQSGVLLYQTNCLAIGPGDPLAAYGAVRARKI